jgi:hypothetical protein
MKFQGWELVGPRNAPGTQVVDKSSAHNFGNWVHRLAGDNVAKPRKPTAKLGEAASQADQSQWRYRSAGEAAR